MLLLHCQTIGTLCDVASTLDCCFGGGKGGRERLATCEYVGRLQQLRDQVGSVPCHEALADLLASEDFDDAEYDAAMQRAFGEDFYQVGPPLSSKLHPAWA